MTQKFLTKILDAEEHKLLVHKLRFYWALGNFRVILAKTLISKVSKYV